MTITELIALLEEVKDEEGDVVLGLKIEKDSIIYIEQIAGISYSSFEGYNLTNIE